MISNERNYTDTCISDCHQFNQLCSYGSGQSESPEALMAHSGVHPFCAGNNRRQRRFHRRHALIPPQDAALVFPVWDARHPDHTDTDCDYIGNITHRILSYVREYYTLGTGKPIRGFFV